SEDIDITIDRKALGFHLSHDEISAISRNARERLLKEMQQTCSEFVGKTLMNFLKDSLAPLIKEPFSIQQSESDGQSLLFYYPTLESQTSYISQHVYIECGIRGSMEPAESAFIKPYVSEVMETKPVQVNVLSPLRTFWEKATLLHAEAHRPDEKTTPIRLSRHYYDLFMFARSIYGKSAMSNMALLKDVIHHKTFLFPCAWAQYETILQKEIKLIPNDKKLKAIKADYDQTKIMLFNATPAFDDIISTITEMEGFINDHLQR
ncbi:MAG: nucleotidyl transferase AbiEii/AbiGii toxin family protein, partial [Alphaproteobacteria bacterium]